MAAKALGKARALTIGGLDGINIPAPVYDYERVQFNGDGTITVLIKFWQDQASYDANESAYETRSYQVTEPVALDNLINTALIGEIADFDAA